jgi:hypothetical protein
VKTGVVGICSGVCPVEGLNISGVEPWRSIRESVITLLQLRNWK